MSPLRQCISEVSWEELDYLLVYVPPAMGDARFTLVPTLPVTGSVIACTPQAVAASDARKAIMIFRQPQINVPVLGIVENMAYFTPEELPDNRYYIFGKGGARQMAEQFEVPFLGEVPLVQSIREGGDKGVPAM